MIEFHSIRNPRRSIPFPLSLPLGFSLCVVNYFVFSPVFRCTFSLSSLGSLCLAPLTLLLLYPLEDDTGECRYILEFRYHRCARIGETRALFLPHPNTNRLRWDCETGNHVLARYLWVYHTATPPAFNVQTGPPIPPSIPTQSQIFRRPTRKERGAGNAMEERIEGEIATRRQVQRTRQHTEPWPRKHREGFE